MARAAFFYCLLFAALLSPRAAEHDLDEAKAAFRAGEFKEVIQQAEAAIKERERGEDWPLLLAESLWMTGQYPEAAKAIQRAQSLYYYSIRVRLAGYRIYRSAGDLESAGNALDQINSLGGSRRWGPREPIDLVALGEAAVLMGADPKLVLDNFYNPVKKAEPELREVYLAIGNLALEKHDYALAGKAFQEGLAKHPDDPDLLFGLAEALAPSDRGEMIKVIEKIENGAHIGARLLMAEHLIDAEEYDEAERELKTVESVNPNRPEMWAFRAVIAHLKNDSKAEEEARAAGLKYWKTNPVVDHIIGRKLSQKYRFAEGAEYQRQAIKFDPRFLPAQAQLAQDLLRLGEEESGWRMAELVNRTDAYDVSAYNLVTLRDTMKKFVALTNDQFVLRMSEHEANIYGRDALELLERAREQLTKKYEMELTRPVVVEIFPEQKDFAVRTFGMPGQEGYLGVCFGNVITANSPASHRMNWHSVLWHEFCHVVTLNLTRNKMPRWLSEGISVYEERRASPRWGERMNPQYRELILTGKMNEISDMSSAFMAPPSGLHLQFAYFQSSLVVEFIIQKHGLEAIRAILRDLGEGKEINEAIAAHTTSMDILQEDFEAFAKAEAESLGPDLVWDKPDRDDDGEIVKAWAAVRPNNFWVLRERAEEFLEAGETNQALPLLEQMIEIYPAQSGEESAYTMLASIYKKQGDTEKERELLRRAVRHDDEPHDALLRLLELESAKDRKRFAEDLLEINPLIPQPHRALARANEESAQVESAIESYHTVLKLDPPDTADVHYRLARLYKENGEPKARRHILLALEEAPRYREAHRMLLALKEDMPEKKTNSAPVIRTIDKGTRSGMKEAFQISVTDQERFKELWTKHTSQRDPAPPAPAIDFEKETILWVSAGQKNTGGYRIDILQVEQNEDEMVVKYAATSPEEGAITTQALTAPFHIAVVPTTTRKIKFQEIFPVSKAER